MIQSVCVVCVVLGATSVDDVTSKDGQHQPVDDDIRGPSASSFIWRTLVRQSSDATQDDKHGIGAPDSASAGLPCPASSAHNLSNAEHPPSRLIIVISKDMRIASRKTQESRFISCDISNTSICSGISASGCFPRHY